MCKNKGNYFWRLLENMVGAWKISLKDRGDSGGEHLGHTFKGEPHPKRCHPLPNTPQLRVAQKGCPPVPEGAAPGHSGKRLLQWKPLLRATRHSSEALLTPSWRGVQCFGAMSGCSGKWLPQLKIAAKAASGSSFTLLLNGCGGGAASITAP